VRIGLLEDDKSQIELFGLWTRENGDQLQSWTSGESFRKAMDHENFDLLVLDWHLPDTTGIDELDWLRSHKSVDTPVIFITSRDSEASVVEALDHGADDYMVKPVKKNIAIARIRALQRRHNITDTAESSSKTDSTETFVPYQFNMQEGNVTLNGEVIKMTHKEFELAHYLFQHAGSLVSRATLMETIWETTAELNTRTVDTHISRIRSKLKINPAHGWQLSSIYQRGYRLIQINAE
jgi:DNA-binding response OmpR family regulator